MGSLEKGLELDNTLLCFEQCSGAVSCFVSTEAIYLALFRAQTGALHVLVKCSERWRQDTSPAGHSRSGRPQQAVAGQQQGRRAQLVAAESAATCGVCTF